VSGFLSRKSPGRMTGKVFIVNIIPFVIILEMLSAACA